MATWRPMRPADLPAVAGIENIVHASQPEPPRVAAERLALCPQGCFVLDDGAALQGYAVTHPWRLYQAVPFNTLLGAIPAAADTWYVHDVALLPDARRGGHGAVIAHRLVEQVAADYPTLSLIAVYGSGPFWRRFGFRPDMRPHLIDQLASYAGEAEYMVLRR